MKINLKKEQTMAELKKTQFSNVNEEIISMEFDNNPNIPTANYGEETAIKIQETIKKKMRAEKLKKMIESELKQDKKKESVESIFDLSFKSM